MPDFTAHLKAQLQKRRIPLVSHVTFTAQEKDAPLGESPLIRPPGFWIGKHRRPFVCFTEKSLDHWNREVIEGQLNMLTACTLRSLYAWLPENVTTARPSNTVRVTAIVLGSD